MSSFARESVDYLGHHVSGQGVSVQSAKVKAIAEAEAPKNLSAVTTFLGAIGFYRKFIPEFSKIALPLSKLANEKVYRWEVEHNAPWDKLNEKLTMSPILLVKYDGVSEISVATGCIKGSYRSSAIAKDNRVIGRQ